MSDEDKQNERRRDEARVKEAIDTLMEHFDAVQIFATRNETGALGGTVSISMGGGCWFSRYGKVQEWCVRQDEMTRLEARRDVIREDGE